MTRRAKINIFPDPQQVAKAVADLFVELAETANVDHGRFSVALSGGATPRLLYQTLASPAYHKKIDWARLHLFYGDERCLPRAHPDSTFQMVNEVLISQVNPPAENVHPINCTTEPVVSAEKYEEVLKSFFAGAPWPRFDLVLLGLGADGHTASLFPHSPALKETKAWVSANYVARLEAFRVTLTAQAINSAQNILFLVTGEEKAEVLRAVLNGPHDPQNLPAQLIDPPEGAVTWFVDAAAARLLASKGA